MDISLSEDKQQQNNKKYSGLFFYTIFFQPMCLYASQIFYCLFFLSVQGDGDTHIGLMVILAVLQASTVLLNKTLQHSISSPESPFIQRRVAL